MAWIKFCNGIVEKTKIVPQSTHKYSAFDSTLFLQYSINKMLNFTLIQNFEIYDIICRQESYIKQFLITHNLANHDR